MIGKYFRIKSLLIRYKTTTDISYLSINIFLASLLLSMLLSSFKKINIDLYSWRKLKGMLLELKMFNWQVNHTWRFSDNFFTRFMKEYKQFWGFKSLLSLLMGFSHQRLFSQNLLEMIFLNNYWSDIKYHQKFSHILI